MHLPLYCECLFRSSTFSQCFHKCVLKSRTTYLLAIVQVCVREPLLACLWPLTKQFTISKISLDFKNSKTKMFQDILSNFFCFFFCFSFGNPPPPNENTTFQFTQIQNFFHFKNSAQFKDIYICIFRRL